MKKRFRTKPAASSPLTFLHREEQPQPAHLSGTGLRPLTLGEVGGQCFQLAIGKDFRVYYRVGATVWILCVLQMHMC